MIKREFNLCSDYVFMILEKAGDSLLWTELIYSFYFIFFVGGRRLKKKIQRQNILHCKKVSSAASLLRLCMEWEQQSQMVNKCSFEGALHKTWFLHGPAVS